METTGKPVDRLKKKTKQERNKKVRIKQLKYFQIANKAQSKEQEQIRKQKKKDHQFDIMDTLIR